MSNNIGLTILLCIGIVLPETLTITITCTHVLPTMIWTWSSSSAALMSRRLDALLSHYLKALDHSPFTGWSFSNEYKYWSILQHFTITIFFIWKYCCRSQSFKNMKRELFNSSCGINDRFKGWAQTIRINLIAIVIGHSNIPLLYFVF